MILIEAESVEILNKSKFNTDWPILQADLSTPTDIDYIHVSLFKDAQYLIDASLKVCDTSLKIYVGQDVEILTQLRNWHKIQNRNVICILCDLTGHSVNKHWVNRVSSIEALILVLNYHLSYELIPQLIQR